MVCAREFAALSDSLFVWQVYDPAVKSDLYSSALKTSAGLMIVDPVPLNSDSLRDLVDGQTIAKIAVTNSNHARAAHQFAENFGAKIYAHPRTIASCEFSPDQVESCPDGPLPDIQAIAIAGAALGEIALFQSTTRGTMIVGDALINFEPYGFTFLPDKYCSDAQQMRRELQRLLDFSFERMLFAHGTPILKGARARLELLLAKET